MKILMGNHALDSYAGTETFTYALACELKRLEHDVICFSPRLGKLSDRLQESDITVTDDLATLPNDIDVIHAHHRHESLLAFSRFADKPMVFVCHGVLPWQEQPFRSPLNIHRYVAVSEEVRDHLIRQLRIDSNRVLIIRNGIDLRRFASRRPIRSRPRHALVLSNYMPDSLRGLISGVCRRLGITVSHVGRTRSVWAVEQEINRADVVFALGRSALEAMACRRVVIVVDYNGADGLVTPQNFHLLRLRNFSGRTYRHQYTEQSLQEEIERYDPGIVEPIYEVIRREHDVKQIARQFATLYGDATCQPPWEGRGPAELAIRRCRAAAELIEDVDGLRLLVDARDRLLEGIQSSRGWKALLVIRRMRWRVASWLSRPSPVPRKKRILVVDDDPLFTGWLTDALTTEGHEVDAAHNGRGALERLERNAYDLILSDLRMPQMDGVELYRRLERDLPQAARRVMFLSGQSDAPEYAEFLGEVRGRSMVKPVGLLELQDLVRGRLGVREG
jgi:CheY-like chemotaxis protein